MGIDLTNYEQRAGEAVRLFWKNRELAKLKQSQTGKSDQGERSSVTAGRNMDGFADLIQTIIQINGIPERDIYWQRSSLVLPGFFRAAKQWDLLVIHQKKLVAAIELKSHIGPSFANNFNNRVEEAVGTAQDLWTAYREKAFVSYGQPFIGWLMFVEDAPESKSPVKDRSPHFPCLEHC